VKQTEGVALPRRLRAGAAAPRPPSYGSDSAALIALISSSIVTLPSPLTSKAGQTLIGWMPRAMFTPVIRSSIDTMPLPAQSPGIVVGVAVALAVRVTVAVTVAGGDGLVGVVDCVGLAVTVAEAVPAGVAVAV